MLVLCVFVVGLTLLILPLGTTNEAFFYASLSSGSTIVLIGTLYMIYRKEPS